VQTCPDDLACNPDLVAPKAGLCLDGDRIVIDGRGADGRRSGQLASGSSDPLIRVYGADVELRGLVLKGSLTATGAQADTGSRPADTTDGQADTGSSPAAKD